jgi:general stress protein 26
MVVATAQDMTQAQATDQKSPETVERLVALLREFEAATLVTRARGGSLHGRPMSIAAVDDDVAIWFITSVRSAKADEVAEDSRAMVTLQGGSRFVCLNGNVELVFDPERIKALWRESYRVWYRNERDPDIVLLKFTSFDAEYWDNSGATGLSYAFQAARAYVTGKELDERSGDDPESHAKLKLWSVPEAPDTVEPSDPLVSRR